MTVIQLVEDDPDVALVVRVMLKLDHPELEIRTLQRREDLLGAMNASLWEGVDVAVVDYQLSGVAFTGIDLLKWLKDASPSTRRVLLTAMPLRAVEGVGVDCCDVVLTKPVGVENLAEAVGL